MAEALAERQTDRGAFSVITDIPGRLRLRLDRQTDASDLEDQLRAVDGVGACAWTPRTRSLLVLYRPDTATHATILDRVTAWAGADLATEPPPADSATPRIAIGVRRGLAELNAAVARSTRGMLDLRVGLPLVLALWAVREIVRGAGGPLAWSTALWYAHGLFRDYNILVVDE
jgi:hypothetical protein